ncbi:MAG: hypothetical protein R3B90_17625 [Planctomycetaceae bacterium]
MLRKTLAVGLLAAMLAASSTQAADLYGLGAGNPELQSIGPMAFGPAGIIFVGDSKGGAIFALQTGDRDGDAAQASFNVEGLNVKIAEALGSSSQETQIVDIAVNPETGNVFAAVMASGKPALVKVASGGEVSVVSMEKIHYAKAELVDVPEDKVVGEGRRARNNRMSTVTDLAFVDGRLLVSGMSDAKAPSAVRSIEFPFDDVQQGTSVEIFHAAHGQVEDYATVRTFVPFNINGEPNVLAGFTCTPLVRFPVSKLQPSEKLRGTTVAELGNRNTPIDMIAYQRDGENFLLIANDRRGVMKVSTADIEKNAGLTNPVGGGGTAGQPYETIESWQNVVQLDKLNDTHAVVLLQAEGAPATLKSVELP